MQVRKVSHHAVHHVCVYHDSGNDARNTQVNSKQILNGASGKYIGRHCLGCNKKAQLTQTERATAVHV